MQRLFTPCVRRARRVPYDVGNPHPLLLISTPLLATQEIRLHLFREVYTGRVL